MLDIVKEYQRVYAEINLDALIHNFINIADITKPDTKIFAVLKTDAYGHCAVPIAKELEVYDKLYGFALATAEEALILRNSGITKPMLILGYTFPNRYEDMIRKDISFTVFRLENLKEIAEAVRRVSSTEYAYKAKIHIKVDTGMGRIGIEPDESGLEFVREALKYDELIIEGLFTHLAKSDESNRDYTLKQIDIFKSFADRIEKELGYKIPYKHISNSAGIIEYPEANMDIVRAGIILYGLWPSSEVNKSKLDLHPVFSLHSRIIFIKEVDEGKSISYGGTFVSDSRMKVATVSIGYGEGYPRSLSNKADVLVKGQRCRILGRVCMDQMMIDVTNVPNVSEGDFVTLIGREGSEEITMEELGDLSGRFNYEMACDFGKRIPRVFTKEHQVKYTKDYYDDF